MKRAIIIFLILLLAPALFSQRMPYKNGTYLQLRLLDEQIVINRSSTGFDFRVSISNCSDNSVILYGFKIVDPGNSRVENYLRSDGIVGNALLVFDGERQISLISLPDLPGYSRSKDSGNLLIDSTLYVGNIIKMHGDFLFEKKLLLKKKASWTGKLHANVLITDREKNGEYEMVLIFNCGENIDNLINADRIARDEIENKSKIFQGHVRSNAIKLLIK